MLLSACGTTLSLSPDEYARGAQQGWIVGMYGPEIPASGLPECLAELGPEALGSHQFAKVQYHRGRALMTVVAELQAPLSAAVGDDVAMWLQPCTAQGHSMIFKVAAHTARR